MMRKSIPLILIVFRVFLAPIVLFIAYELPEYKFWIVICCYLAIISDIFDGIIARKLGVATQKIRIYDCWADFIFWLSALWCIWVCFPHLVLENPILVSLLFIFEFIPDSIYLVRFRKQGCSHAYSSKFFGISLVIAFTCLFGWEIAGIPFYLALFAGLISQIDRILIALLLPSRICDIPSFYHSWLLRQGKTFNRNPMFH
jgi:phosphatidylglycerophosphate synthase